VKALFAAAPGAAIQSTVETDQWQERKDGLGANRADIFVERESQRKIVLGKGGQTIKAIGAEARHDIAKIVEHPCTCSCS